MSKETDHKVIYEDKIVIDSRTKVRGIKDVLKEAPSSQTDRAPGDASDEQSDTEETSQPVNDRPRLLFVITQGMWDDPQKYIVQLAEYFAPRYELHVVFGTYEFTGKNVFRTEFEKIGGTVHTIDALTHKPVLGNELASVIKMVGLLKEIKPDIVHCNDAKASFIAGCARMLAGGSRQIATIHSFTNTSDNKSYEVAIFEFFVKLSYNRSTVLIIRDQYTHQKAEKMFGKKARLILPGIKEIKFLNPQEKMRSIIQDAPDKIAGYVQNQETLIIGNIAPLEADQGIAYTLGALKTLKEEGLVFVYIHYGEGDQKYLLEHEVVEFGLEDRVLFKGLDKLAPLYLQVFDVVVQPTLRPGDLNLLRDCGLAQRAVIISDVEGVSGTIEHDVHALIVKQRNTEELTQAIRDLAGDKPRRDRLGQALEQRVRDQYSAEEMFRKTEEIYEG